MDPEARTRGEDVTPVSRPPIKAVPTPVARSLTPYEPPTLSVLYRSAWRRGFKRSFDVIMATLGMIALIPFGLLIAVIVKLDSRGPVFYRHHRIGRDGVPFMVYKFRTMVRDADQVLERFLEAHPELRAEWDSDQKLRFDPRVSRVGRVLRKYSLDEFPQLLNVVRGEMSLVGPRPIVEDEVERFGAYAPAVLSVRPGITGLWTVSGRTLLTYRERAALEYRYVKDWSLAMDVAILVKTIPAVIRGQGAY